MKFTATVVLCTLVVLFQKMETPLAQVSTLFLINQPTYRSFRIQKWEFLPNFSISPQYCSAPQCSAAGFLDSYSCQCVNFTKSECPVGTTEVVDEEGQCSCQTSVHPLCDAGYTLNPDLCVCKIKLPPSCPDRTHLLSSDALCFGVEEPYCPKGFKQVGCKCVKNVDRECETGEITSDGCKCKNTYTPECSDGCSLNITGQCACEGKPPTE